MGADMETSIEKEKMNHDEIILKKKDEDGLSVQLSSDDLTCWDLLDQTSSLLDTYDIGKSLDKINFDEIIEKQKHKKPNIRPYVAINDLNNSDDEPYVNKPKPAIEIGAIFDF